jgi:hypothetical protein
LAPFLTAAIVRSLPAATGPADQYFTDQIKVFKRRQNPIHVFQVCKRVFNHIMLNPPMNCLDGSISSLLLCR